MPSYGKFTMVKLQYATLYIREAGTSNTAMQQGLAAMKRRTADLRVPFEASKQDMLDQTVQVFAAQGIPQPWPPLSPVYAAWKARRYPGMPILRRTDALFASLTQDGGPGQVWLTTPRTIQYGTHVPHWIYHQLGTRRMPARPPLVLLPETLRRIAERVTLFLSGSPRSGRGRA